MQYKGKSQFFRRKWKFLYKIPFSCVFLPISKRVRKSRISFKKSMIFQVFSIFSIFCHFFDFAAIFFNFCLKKVKKNDVSRLFGVVFPPSGGVFFPWFPMIFYDFFRVFFIFSVLWKKACFRTEKFQKIVKIVKNRETSVCVLGENVVFWQLFLSDFWGVHFLMKKCEKIKKKSIFLIFLPQKSCFFSPVISGYQFRVFAKKSAFFRPYIALV